MYYIILHLFSFVNYLDDRRVSQNSNGGNMHLSGVQATPSFEEVF